MRSQISKSILPAAQKCRRSARSSMTASLTVVGAVPRAALAALSADRAVAWRRALRSEVIDGVENIGCSFRGCSQREKKKPGLRAGGVNGLHGCSVRAPVDDADRTGTMSVKD